MVLKDLLQNLALGELAGSNLVELGGYTIVPKHLPKVIHAINQSLDHLYTTLPIKDSEVIVRILPNLTHYYLSSDYASTNPDAKYAYIMDSSVTPFKDDVLMITDVANECGQMLAMNDELAMEGVFTPEYNCIRLTEGAMRNKRLTVVYRAKHVPIPLNAGVNSRFEVVIPSSLVTALQTYAASQIFMYAQGEDNKMLSNQLFSKYQNIIETLKLEGFGVRPQTGVNIKPLMRGWL